MKKSPKTAAKLQVRSNVVRKLDIKDTQAADGGNYPSISVVSKSVSIIDITH